MKDLENESQVPGLGVYRDGPVLRLRLERPEKRNSLSLEMRTRMSGYIEEAGSDEEVRVIALSGEGEHFCGGADIVAGNLPRDRRPRVGSIQRRLPREAHRLIPVMLTVQTPIVCVVRGWASGIGLHLALASDFAIAARSARLWEPFARRGFAADSGASWLLPRAVGMARAREMLLLGREVSGEQAAAWGMIHRAVDDAELESAAESLVQELAGSATVAVGLMKCSLLRAQELDLEHALANEAFGLELSSRSLDFKEGLAAFAEKRPPRFEGR